MEKNVLSEKIMSMLFDTGAVKFDIEKKSLPFELNLRTQDNHKSGPLGKDGLELIAEGLLTIVYEYGLDFDVIAGIPDAGKLFAEAMVSFAPESLGFRIFPLDQTEKDGERIIIPRHGFKCQNKTILLVNDSIARADIKLEAIEAIKKVGGNVKEILVLVDRQQGGVNELRERGYKVYFLFTIRKLMQFGIETRRIEKKVYDECIAYLAMN